MNNKLIETLNNAKSNYRMLRAVHLDNHATVEICDVEIQNINTLLSELTTVPTIEEQMTDFESDFKENEKLRSDYALLLDTKNEDISNLEDFLIIAKQDNEKLKSFANTVIDAKFYNYLASQLGLLDKYFVKTKILK